ncbi:DASH family cryptochrome [Paraferrimonas sp. SM1919]|uniref:DASH family cryptochrome n=1 Tax=Paraferrimonas sp. SM1919 TaxID=2662263 RepID=UPI0013D6B672|nr:DASH family cryptochrome [Paraferrimonas sp. SM1919]
MNTGLYWFHHDCRLADNALLQQAAKQCTHLKLLHFQQLTSSYEQHFLPVRNDNTPKTQFMLQSNHELNQQLMRFGQWLEIIPACSVLQALNHLLEIINQHHINHLYISHTSCFYTNKVVAKLATQLPELNIHRVHNNSLFEPQQLAFDIGGLPTSFSKFRKISEPIKQLAIAATVDSMPPPFDAPTQNLLRDFAIDSTKPVHGGEIHGQQHLHSYFSSHAPSTYKQTRNALDDWSSSTKFSYWLANGNLSARQVLYALRQYEYQHGANESTYWISFELLWREYFYWYAVHHGAKLFRFTGINHHKPLTSFYSQRLQVWINGTTPYPIINACMKQLKHTGYMSNRGRQLAASCFVHELGLDWRYGAMYFQHQLIDHDVGSNWGNWQYLAGVGADPRGHRRFDLTKQTQMYDPFNQFIKRWQGHIVNTPLDNVDLADWPQ